MQGDSPSGKRAHSPWEACHYLHEMVVGPFEERRRAGGTLDQPGVSAGEWGVGDLLELLDGLDEEEVARFGERLDLIRLHDSDPHETARALRTVGGVRASVIHGIGHLGHARAMAGEGPFKSDGDVTGDPVDESAPIIAVGDTGIADEETLGEWPWMQSPSVMAEQQDRERADPASHGTYVVSLIRQNRPDRAVLLAAARPRLMMTNAP